jgi:nitrite reductase/ring-hydroxylating ferredoxin subunit
MEMPASLRPTEGQLALARAVAEARSSDGAAISTVPACVYTDPARFMAERSRLFEALPQVIAPSALLPRSNMAVPHDGFGLPLLLTRDRAGQAHVFYNVCRHRGTRLVEGGDTLSAPRIVCPYHAWSYGMDGALRRSPAPNAFPGSTRPITIYRTARAWRLGGLIWFAREQADFARGSELAPEFDAFGLPAIISTAAGPRRSRQLEADHGRFPGKLPRPAPPCLHHRQVLRRRHHRRRQLGPHQRSAVGRSEYLARSITATGRRCGPRSPSPTSSSRQR